MVIRTVYLIATTIQQTHPWNALTILLCGVAQVIFFTHHANTCRNVTTHNIQLNKILQKYFYNREQVFCLLMKRLKVQYILVD